MTLHRCVHHDTQPLYIKAFVPTAEKVCI